MHEVASQMVFIGILGVLFVYDARSGILPDVVTLPAIALVVAWNLMGGYVPLVAMVWGAIAVGGFFALQFAVSRGRWIGDGDIRMGVLIGVMLGLWPAVIATFFAYVIGAMVSVLLVVVGKKDRRATVPFGTYLAVASGFMLVWGDRVVAWYAQWLR